MNSEKKSNSIKDDKDDSSNLEQNNNSDKENDLGNENYNFGWSKYSERTNGRFAMIGFTAIILIELISHHSFFSWAGILN